MEREAEFRRWLIGQLRSSARSGRVLALYGPDLDRLPPFPDRVQVERIEAESTEEVVEKYLHGAGYASQVWLDRKQEERRRNPRKPHPLHVFYHIACMNNWREVVQEQWELLKETGIPVTAGVLGTDEDCQWVKDLGIPVGYHGYDLQEYEIPTLQLVWEWAKANPDGAVMYLHTKGVSQPNDPSKQPWRKLMEYCVVHLWQDRLNDLTIYDAVGVSWMTDSSYPHFCGNFWMARASWLAKLSAPRAYQNKSGPWIGGHPWRRMCAEMWIGSKPGILIKSLVGNNLNLRISHIVQEIWEDVSSGRRAI